MIKHAALAEVIFNTIAFAIIVVYVVSQALREK